MGRCVVAGTWYCRQEVVGRSSMMGCAVGGVQCVV